MADAHSTLALKRCLKCGRTLPLDCFPLTGKSWKAPDDRASPCKRCKRNTGNVLRRRKQITMPRKKSATRDCAADERQHGEQIVRLLAEIRDLLKWRFRDDELPVAAEARAPEKA